MSIDHSPAGTSPQISGPARIVFFGRRCELSSVPLRALLERHFDVAAVLIATPTPFGPAIRRLSARSSIPLGLRSHDSFPHTIDDVARDHEVPLFGLRKPLDIELKRLVADLAPSLIVVSCFPWRLPADVSGLARLGAVNLHPSPLPEFRGPDPLFWAFQTNRREWAVSVHRLTAALDTGPILGQVRIRIPEEIPGNVFESHVASTGGELLASVVSSLLEGDRQESEQDELLASYQSYPGPADLLVGTDWTVQRALNFIAGVIPLGYSPLIETEQGTFQIRGASRESRTDIRHGAGTGGDRLAVRLADGVLTITLGNQIEDS